MANSKLIIIEGPQGTGKTTVSDFIRYNLPYTNLYRLSGISDSSPSGLEKTKKMYFSLLDYMSSLQNLNINLVLDRTFFSEEVYCRLGFKEYSFTDTYKELLKKLNELDFEIYYINLYLSDTFLFEKRLQREGKCNPKYAHFNTNSSIKQQKKYLDILKEIKETCNNIKTYSISNDATLDSLKNKIKKIIE